jgi:hypothetical protein
MMANLPSVLVFLGLAMIVTTVLVGLYRLRR